MPDVPNLRLNNGLEIPQLGIGVWQAQQGQEVEQALRNAFDAGYRLVDTAAIYGNEKSVGKAVKASGLEREEIFLTTKLWNADQGCGSTLKAFDASLKKLATDYVDLYLIHWPMPKVGKFVDTWKAFEKLYTDGRVRAIGVSNFKPTHLQILLDAANIVPTVNQIELHPQLTQVETRVFCARYDIAIESYSPIMHGGEVLDDATIRSIAEAHSKRPAQIVLRWHIQHGFIAIPKSVTPERIRENIDIFDFELSNVEMRAIDAMDTGTRVSADPDIFNSAMPF